MWCCLPWRRLSSDGVDDTRAQAEKQRELRGMPMPMQMPQRRDLSTMAPRRELAAVPRDRRIPPERRETIKATTEFKWPPRMSEVTLSPSPSPSPSPRPTVVNHHHHHQHHQQQHHHHHHHHQYEHTTPMADTTTRDGAVITEAALASPTSFNFAPEPVLFLEHEYHISPQVSQDMLSHKYKYGPPAPAPASESLPELAELPPNELVPREVHELAGPTPPVVFPQELEGSPRESPLSPRLARSPTPTSRFSPRR
ncbi:unnamed protein product [Discula destructiva]